jgi:thiamine biosynthesis lipoprotein
MRKVINVLLIIVLFGCGEAPEKVDSANHSATEIIIKGKAQGTTYTIKYLAETYEEGLKEKFDSVLHAIDMSMSTYVPTSQISRLNDGDTVKVDPLFLAVYNLSKAINNLTDGAFDPTIGPLIKAWGFDFSDPQKMDSILVKSLLSNVGFDQFVVQSDTIYAKQEFARINFNAVAQGYSVDVMKKLLDDRGFDNYYIELGGELIVKGHNKFNEDWIIGIDRPDGENFERNLAQRVKLKNSAMATSGNYRKFYEVDGKRYSHTLDPKTGYPAENNLLSATVIANDGGTADALATAFMVMGVEKTKVFLTENPTIKAYLIMDKKGEGFQTYYSPSLENQLLKD